MTPLTAGGVASKADATNHRELSGHSSLTIITPSLALSPSFLLSNVQVNLTVGGVASEANVTDIHEALHFHGGGGPDEEDDP